MRISREDLLLIFSEYFLLPSRQPTSNYGIHVSVSPLMLLSEKPPQNTENAAKEEEEEESFQTNWDESVEKFDDLDLKEEVLRGIYGYGFERPSPIQQKGILPLIKGKDTIAQVSGLNCAKVNMHPQCRPNLGLVRQPPSRSESCKRSTARARNARRSS